MERVVLIMGLFGMIVAQCVDPIMPGFDESDFYSEPAPVQLVACPQFGQSCCHTEYSQKIHNNTDPLSKSFLQVIPSPMGSCRSNLQAISCLLCSPYQAQWITVDYNTESTLFSMCESYCMQVYESCLGSTLSPLLYNDTVRGHFTTADSFCLELFSSIQNSTASVQVVIVDDSDDFCWKNKPACTEDSYFFNYTECVDGRRDQMWFLNETCYGGLGIPDNVYDIPCGRICGSGEYFSIDEDTCMRAPKGYYSPGNGFLKTSWDILEPFFINRGWLGRGDSIQSALAFSSLILSQNFVIDGSISITFSVSTYGENTAGFVVKVNDVESSPRFSSTRGDFISFEIQIQSGFHEIEFIFEMSETHDKDMEPQYARISKLLLLGTTQAVTSPSICPPGTYSPIEGASECITCPRNTFSEEGAETCISCPNDHYALPGSSSCSERSLCTSRDYVVGFTMCENGEQQSYYNLVNSKCLELSPPASSDIFDCFPCEKGSYRPTGLDECIQCEVGKYWNEVSQQCETSKPGNAALLYTSYFSSPISHAPSEFTSYCSGNCICGNNPSCSSGWDFNSFYLSSGDNGKGALHSILDLNRNMMHNGQITFTYAVMGDKENGLWFFINDKQQEFEFHPSSVERIVSFSVSAGHTQFRWVYHQEENTSGEAILLHILIEGSGGATADLLAPPGKMASGFSGSSSFIDCPEGEAKEGFGGVTCLPCRNGTYAPIPGLAECIQCGNHTKPNQEGTSCDSESVITFGYQQFNLSSLRGIKGPIQVPNTSDTMWFNALKQDRFDDKCSDDRESVESYFCITTNRAFGTSVGNYLSIESVSLGGQRDNHYGILLVYSDIEDTNWKSTIEITCDESTDSSLPFFLDVPQNGTFRMRWYTPAGCPVCLEPIVQNTSVSECVEGERIVTVSESGACKQPSIILKTSESCSSGYRVTMFQLVVLCFGTFFICFVVLLFIVAGWLVKLRQYNPSNVNHTDIEMATFPQKHDLEMINK